jgi:hypothetical protein
MAGLVPAIHVLRNFDMAGGWVYILTNRPNGILYVGVTSDLVRRIYEHRSGFVEGFTKRYGLKRLGLFRAVRQYPRRDPTRAQHQALVPRVEGPENCRCQSGLGRSFRNDREVKTWMPGTRPGMTSWASKLCSVMAGLVPAIHVLLWE